MTESVLLIGGGNMGFALLRGWLRDALEPQQVTLVEPIADLRARAASLSVASYENESSLPVTLSPRLIVLAVKPQVLVGALAPYARFADGKTTFLSIAAGIGSDAILSGLGGKTPVIRCMPNTPAAIGHGAIVCYANAHVRPAEAAFAQQLLSAVGQVSFVEDESLMDAVTAVSGSGPAYVFHFIECLTTAGQAAGLPARLAAELALQTVAGSARLAAESTNKPSELRRQVTSPGGTTAAALEVLMGKSGLRDLVADAVTAATERARELGKD